VFTFHIFAIYLLYNAFFAIVCYDFLNVLINHIFIQIPQNIKDYLE